MSKIFQLPVKVINDADAAALAEARYGSLQDLDCGAALVLGTGVGLGLVSQGSLVNTSVGLPNICVLPKSPKLGSNRSPFQLGPFKHALFSLVANKRVCGRFRS